MGVLFFHVIHMSLDARKPSSGFPTRSNKNYTPTDESLNLEILGRSTQGIVLSM